MCVYVCIGLRSLSVNLSYMHVNVGLGLSLAFVHLFRFSILCVFWFSLNYYVLALFAFVVLGLVSSLLRQEISYRKNVSETRQHALTFPPA